MYKTGFTILIFSVAVLVLSCERIDTGNDISVSLNKKYNVSWDLSFTIDSIHEYRCPTDVICVWGGDVDLFFNFGNNGNTPELINLNNNDTNPFSISGYTFEVLDVLPYPRSDATVPSEDVTVKLIITKN